MCRVLQVSRSRYYSWRHCPISNRARRDQFLTEQIKVIFNNSKQKYGIRKVQNDMIKQGISISRKRVSRLMKEANLKPKLNVKYKATTNSNHKLNIAPNLLKRDFYCAKPNRVWTGDITQIKTREGDLYLAIVIDLCSRKIVGWSMDSNMKADLVNNALTMALFRRKPGKGLIWHTDRGSQYCSISHRKIVKDHSIIQSMSRKGDCWDNATSESFFSILKRELDGIGNFANRSQAKAAIFEFIEIFYDTIRSHSTIDYVAPSQFEEKIITIK